MRCKRVVSLFLTLIMVIGAFSIPVYAESEIKVFVDGFSGINGERISFDVPPQTINNRTMVPIRAIFEAMGATVNWDAASQTAICTKENTTVKMTLNSTIEYINDITCTMDVAPVIIAGRTLAPARYVAEAFGYNVAWDEMTKSVLISKDTNYNISNVVDGTREHPYQLGDTACFTFFGYNDSEGICNVTLNTVLSPEKAKEKFGENVFSSNNLWCLKGHLKLVEYNKEDSCDRSEMIYIAEAVTSNFKTLGDYMWYSSPSPFDLGAELYEGGETDCYIQLHPEKLSEGETIDYFTITYLSGKSYNDKKTIWFSLK